MGTLTISNNDYSVYGDLAGREVYFAASLRGDLYTAASADQQNKAHVTATRMLDRQSWFGSKSEDDQANAFPRSGLSYPDGTTVDSASVPVEIIRGTYELILSLLGDENVETSSGEEAQVKQVKAGTASVEFFEKSAEAEAQSAALVLPKTVQDLVTPFLRASSSAARPIGVGSVSGSDYVSPGVSDFEVTQ